MRKSHEEETLQQTVWESGWFLLGRERAGLPLPAWELCTKKHFQPYKWSVYCWDISSHWIFFFFNLTLERKKKFVMLVKVPVDSTQYSCLCSSCSGKNSCGRNPRRVIELVIRKQWWHSAQMLSNPLWASHVFVLLWFQTANALSLRL